MGGDIPQIIAYAKQLRYVLKHFSKGNLDVDKLKIKCVIYNENDMLVFDPDTMHGQVNKFYSDIILAYQHPDIPLTMPEFLGKLDQLPWNWFY